MAKCNQLTPLPVERLRFISLQYFVIVGLSWHFGIMCNSVAALWFIVLNACCSEDASDLQDFLRSCNPRQQLSVTFESYLIKPIQRILKYPLLLRQLMELTEPYTDEHRHLAGDGGDTPAYWSFPRKMFIVYLHAT